MPEGRVLDGVEIERIIMVPADDPFATGAYMVPKEPGDD